MVRMTYEDFVQALDASALPHKWRRQAMSSSEEALIRREKGEQLRAEMHAVFSRAYGEPVLYLNVYE